MIAVTPGPPCQEREKREMGPGLLVRRRATALTYVRSCRGASPDVSVPSSGDWGW